MKIGFIYECGPKGADVDVCQHLAIRLKPEIECVARTLDNKQNLVRECGPVASLLLQNCEHVLIIWDLFPPWREAAPCLHQDRVDFLTPLIMQALTRPRYHLSVSGKSWKRGSLPTNGLYKLSLAK